MSLLVRIEKFFFSALVLISSEGGDLTGFVVERLSEQGPNTTDVLMCGNGQYGGLGNNTFTNNQGNPSRVKTVSGLLQCE